MPPTDGLLRGTAPSTPRDDKGINAPNPERAPGLEVELRAELRAERALDLGRLGCEVFGLLDALTDTCVT